MDAAAIAIGPLMPHHWHDVARIYSEGIATGSATFESEPPSQEDFFATRLPGHRFVALSGDQVVGWAAVTRVSSRMVYEGVVEHSVYVSEAGRGRGAGRLLLEAIIHSTEGAGIWTIQSGIFPENTASLALHESLGFRRIGVRERIARMNHGPFAGQWRDNVMVERRSAVAGTE